jgi:hypothetical protein
MPCKIIKQWWEQFDFGVFFSGELMFFVEFVILNGKNLTKEFIKNEENRFDRKLYNFSIGFKVSRESTTQFVQTGITQ